jgi:hypothetical protein
MTPSPPIPLVLPVNRQLVNTGEQLVEFMTAAPLRVAKLLINVQLLMVGLDCWLTMAPPSWVGMEKPLALPPLRVKPSRTAEASRLLLVMMCMLLSLLSPGVPMSPLRMISYAAQSRSAKVGLPVLGKPP